MADPFEEWEKEVSTPKTYRVLENRMYQAEYLIVAANATEAGLLNGEIIDENYTDSWGHELLEVEETTEEELA